jgi:hypothetical protein
MPKTAQDGNPSDASKQQFCFCEYDKFFTYVVMIFSFRVWRIEHDRNSDYTLWNELEHYTSINV